MLGVCAKDPTYCCTSSNQFSFSARLNHFLIEVLWRLVPALSLEQDGMVSRWVKHLETDRGRFSNKRLREILRERAINAQRAAYWWIYWGVFEMSSGSALKCDIDGGPSPQWWFQLRWNQTCALLTLWVRMDEKRRNLGLGRIRPKLN